jgi:hypothetical protein
LARANLYEARAGQIVLARRCVGIAGDGSGGDHRQGAIFTFGVAVVVTREIILDSAQAESYRKANTGVVCIDRLPKNWSGDTVTADNEAGAYNATRCLLQFQHTRLATIKGPLL